MRSTKPPTSSSSSAARLCLVVACSGWAWPTFGAVVIAPENVDPRQAVNTADPAANAQLFPPLREGDPWDYAHWLSFDNEEPGAGEESVVIDSPRRRPALHASRADIHPEEQVPTRWHAEMASRRATLAMVIRSVGRLEVTNMQTQGTRPHLGTLSGTGFVVKPGLLMTNRHVAKNFFNLETKEFKRNYETKMPAEVWVNFAGIRGEPFDGTRFRIIELVYAPVEDGSVDVALLRFEDPHGSAPQPLSLQLTPPVTQELIGRPVVVCGYPVGKNYQFFRIPGVKRVAPGYLTSYLPVGGEGRYLLHHDSSTDSGNSGSPLVDLQTGRVYGIHSQGEDSDASISMNGAEPTWALPSIAQVHDALGLGMFSNVLLTSTEPLPAPRPAILLDRVGRADVELNKALPNDLKGAWATDVLERSSQAVAYVSVTENGEPTKRVGTGFLVAPRLLLLAGPFAEDAQEFTATFARTFDTEVAQSVPLRAVARFDDGALTRQWVLAEVMPLKDGIAPQLPQPISVLDPLKPSIGRRIAVIGHHSPGAIASDAVRLSLFAGPDLAKRLSPGRLLRPQSGDPIQLAHDASTLRGSMGSPILDLATGRIVGVHLGGGEQGNFGVSLYEYFERLPELANAIREWE